MSVAGKMSAEIDDETLKLRERGDSSVLNSHIKHDRLDIFRYDCIMCITMFISERESASSP